MSQLNQNEVADEIRSLLLGGIRFAWLWRQLGGRRWHLIMRRNPILIALQGLEHTLEYSLDNRS